MTPELEKSLRDDFKSLFEKVDYFDCGDGWEPIVRELSSKIVNITDKVRATCIKQKWGGLRFYFNLLQQELDRQDYKKLEADIDQLVKQAEDKADQICEVCGAKAAGVSSGFVQTLCELHLAKQKAHSLTNTYEKSLEKIDALRRAQAGDGADWNRLIVDPIIEHRKRAGLPPDPKIVRQPEIKTETSNENRRSEAEDL